MASRGRKGKGIMSLLKRHNVMYVGVAAVVVFAAIFFLGKYFGLDLRSMVTGAQTRRGEIMLLDKAGTATHGTWSVVNAGVMIALDDQGVRGSLTGSNLVFSNGQKLTPAPKGTVLKTMTYRSNVTNTNAYAITTDTKTVVFINERGQMVAGNFTSDTKAIVPGWNNITATFSDKQISWSNGTVWAVPTTFGANQNTATTAPLVTDYLDSKGAIVHVILETNPDSFTLLGRPQTYTYVPSPTPTPTSQALQTPVLAATPIPLVLGTPNPSCAAPNFKDTDSATVYNIEVVKLGKNKYQDLVGGVRAQAMESAKNTCLQRFAQLVARNPAAMCPASCSVTASSATTFIPTPGGSPSYGGTYCTPYDKYFPVTCDVSGACRVSGPTENTPSVYCQAAGACSTAYTCN